MFGKFCSSTFPPSFDRSHRLRPMAKRVFPKATATADCRVSALRQKLTFTTTSTDDGLGTVATTLVRDVYACRNPPAIPATLAGYLQYPACTKLPATAVFAHDAKIFLRSSYKEFLALVLATYDDERPTLQPNLLVIDSLMVELAHVPVRRSMGQLGYIYIHNSDWIRRQVEKVDQEAFVPVRRSCLSFGRRRKDTSGGRR